MLREASALHEAAADAIEALVHLGLLAAAGGHCVFAEAAQTAVHALLSAPDAPKIVPADYLTLECA